MRDPHTIHPMSQLSGARVDIFHDGNQHFMTKDMMLMLEQSVPKLDKDEHILLINCLSVHNVLARAADTLSKGHRGKILVYSATGTMLREKLDFLGKLIAAKKIKKLVLNSWEFAANGSRQKHALANWLREMRDAHQVHVVIYSLERELPNVGALNEIAYTATSTDKIGEWAWHDRYVKDQFYPNVTDTVAEYMEIREAAMREQRLEAERLEANPGTESAVVVKPSGGMTMPRKQRGVLAFVGPDEVLERLKNKELSGVGARDLAMAA